MTQYEDNASKSLWVILNGEIEYKRKCIFNFIVKNPDLKYENFWYAEVQEKNIGTRPDLTLHFNDGKKYNVEVKTETNARLTPNEKNNKNRDVFLIPKNYEYESKIEIVKIYWEDLFQEIDSKYNGVGFDELMLTRICLGCYTNCLSHEIMEFLGPGCKDICMQQIFHNLANIKDKIKDEFDVNLFCSYENLKSAKYTFETFKKELNERWYSGFYFKVKNKKVWIGINLCRKEMFSISIEFKKDGYVKKYGPVEEGYVAFPLNYEKDLDEISNKSIKLINWFINNCPENSFPMVKIKGTPVFRLKCLI